MACGALAKRLEASGQESRIRVRLACRGACCAPRGDSHLGWHCAARSDPLRECPETRIGLNLVDGLGPLEEVPHCPTAVPSEPVEGPVSRLPPARVRPPDLPAAGGSTSGEGARQPCPGLVGWVPSGSPQSVALNQTAPSVAVAREAVPRATSSSRCALVSIAAMPWLNRSSSPKERS